jgi:hypothetical protein
LTGSRSIAPCSTLIQLKMVFFENTTIFHRVFHSMCACIYVFVSVAMYVMARWTGKSDIWSNFCLMMTTKFRYSNVFRLQLDYLLDFAHNTSESSWKVPNSPFTSDNTTHTHTHLPTCMSVYSFNLSHAHDSVGTEKSWEKNYRITFWQLKRKNYL